MVLVFTGHEDDRTALHLARLIANHGLDVSIVRVQSMGADAVTEKTNDDKAKDAKTDPKKDSKKASTVAKERPLKSVAKQNLFPRKK